MYVIGLRKKGLGNYIGPLVPVVAPCGGPQGEGEDIDVINTTCNKQDYLLYIAY